MARLKKLVLIFKLHDYGKKGFSLKVEEMARECFQNLFLTSEKKGFIGFLKVRKVKKKKFEK